LEYAVMNHYSHLTIGLCNIELLFFICLLVLNVSELTLPMMCFDVRLLTITFSKHNFISIVLNMNCGVKICF
jgi:hypothetical protein